MPMPPVWRATYRMQLSATFTFADAAEVVPHLANLGVSHLYLSPVLESVAGSTHGYDGTDPTEVSAERGGEAQLRHLAEVAHQAGLGVLLDIVPNHLAADDATRWWADEDLRPTMFDYDPTTGWYRRFFDIDGLAGLRQEDSEVFARTHAKVLELVHDGVVDGLRVDHPDGLADPAGYLERLHCEAGVPIWVEKILQPDEPLRPWPVAGSVGYEFAADATRLFIDPAGETTLTTTYRDLTGDRQTFAEVALQAKREQITGPFARELDQLAALGSDIDRATLAEVIAHFPIYRTYVDPVTGTVTEADRQAVAAAVDAAEAPATL
ncbi:MAG TPA: alpha-amylase family glycosyl hydrolase, partial [Acidimicrobiales bacterium]